MTGILEASRIITLNETEQRLARHLAKSRDKRNSDNSIIDRQVGNQDWDATQLNGVAGEIAFCKYQNIYPDTSTEPRRKGADCEHGIRFDVKTTRVTSGHLIVIRTKQVNDADAYAFMVGTFPTYRFAGWCRAEELIAAENIKDFGYGETYALTQDKLYDNIHRLLNGMNSNKGQSQ